MSYNKRFFIIAHATCGKQHIAPSVMSDSIEIKMFPREIYPNNNAEIISKFILQKPESSITTVNQSIITLPYPKIS